MEIFEGNPRTLTTMAFLRASVSGAAAVAQNFTWNPADKAASVTLSSGNLVSTTSGSSGSVRGTVSKNSGKWYFDATMTTKGNRSQIGVSTASFSLTLTATNSEAWWYWFSGGGTEHAGAVDQSGGGTGTNGDKIGVAVDFTGGKLYYAINNVWQFGADPVAGTGGQTFTGGTVFPMCGVTPSTNPVWTLPTLGTSNYSPPSGYSGWSA